MTIRCILMALVLSMSLVTIGQRLNNPSMEGEPIDATMPDGWHACQLGTTPDILPGPWGVEVAPFDGRSYIGLITRPDGTWEAIGQQFDRPLVPNCYRMSLVAAHAETYAGYNRNGRLRVWLGNEKCEMSKLILDVKELMHSDWKTYDIRFTTESEYKYIIIECYHPEGYQASKGNILIDKIRWPFLCERT